MKKWHIATLAMLFLGLGTTVFAYGPTFGDGRPPFAANEGFHPPFAGAEGFPGPATPWGPGSFRPPFGPSFRGGLGPAQYLDLSEDQLNRMAALGDRYFEETRDLRYAIAQQQLEVRRLFTDPKADEATLLTKQKELSTLRGQLLDKLSQLPIEMRKLLTPEQIGKLDRLPIGRFGAGFGEMGFGAGFISPFSGRW